MAQKILVVEDSPDISRLLEHILGRAGYEVIVVDDGPSGLATFETLQPDLVLLDINLPGISGIDICKQMKTVSSTTPVIMLTVRAESEAIHRGIRAGADAYLSKPFEIAHLIATVEKALQPRIRRISTKKG